MLQKISVTFDHSNASLQNKSIQFFKIKDSVYNKMNNKDCFTPHPKGFMSVCILVEPEGMKTMLMPNIVCVSHV